MKLKTELIRFDAQIAICLASLEQGETCVSVYASARSNEAGNYPDLAQQRALQLARLLVEQGVEALRLPEIVMNVTNLSPAPFIQSPPIALPGENTASGSVPVGNEDSPSPGSLPW
jgi:hypothetical protein